MGRTATAFLMLVAVGGCVADNQGPAAFQTAQMGQSPTAASCYATWSKSDQFAALHEDAPATSPRQTAALALNTPPVANAMAAALPKQLPAPKPLPSSLNGDVVPPLRSGSPLPPPAPATASNEPAIDPELVRTTMVQTPDDRSEAEPHVVKAQKTSLAKKAESEGDQAAPAPGSPTVRMVNTKRITLNYELKDVETSGVSGVELWRTRDGKSWEHGEIVAQTNHSFSVEVKEEGLHGFTLVARGGADGANNAPAPGEHPQIWVMADFTKPAVQITGVEVGHSKSSGVQIHWTAKDKNLGFKPVTLSYAEQAEGPWTKIAAGIENSGQYEWQPPVTVPHRIFLRVEAADLAGNVAAVQTANALRLDSLLTVAAPTPAPMAVASDTTHKLVPVPPAPEAFRPERLASPPVPAAPHADHPLSAPPAPDAPHVDHAPPAPPVPDAGRPSAAILNIEPSGN